MTTTIDTELLKKLIEAAKYVSSGRFSSDSMIRAEAALEHRDTITDSTGKQWGCGVPHCAPVPVLPALGEYALAFSNQGRWSTNTEYWAAATHWIAVKLPPVPVAKTQEELDTEAYVEWRTSTVGDSVTGAWKAALAYERSRKQ